MGCGACKAGVAAVAEPVGKVLHDLRNEFDARMRSARYACCTDEVLGVKDGFKAWEDQGECSPQPDGDHPSAACVDGFKDKLIAAWDAKSGDVLDELCDNLRVHRDAYADFPGDSDDARKKEFLLCHLSRGAEHRARALGSNFPRYDKFQSAGKEYDIMQISLLQTLFYSMGHADVDLFLFHPDALGTKLKSAKEKINYRDRKIAASDETSNCGRCPFEEANEALRVASGEQRRGRMFADSVEGARGVDKWVKFVCLLEAMAEEWSGGAEMCAALDTLTSHARWKKQWDPRLEKAKEAAAECEAFRGIACAFGGGAELVEQWKGLLPGAQTGATSLTSVTLAERVVYDFMKKDEGKKSPLVNILFVFRGMSRVVKIFLGSAYIAEVELLLPLMQRFEVAEAPAVQEAEVGGTPTKVLRVVLQSKASVLPAAFRRRVLDDAVRANARLLAGDATRLAEIDGAAQGYLGKLGHEPAQQYHRWIDQAEIRNLSQLFPKAAAAAPALTTPAGKAEVGQETQEAMATALGFVLRSPRAHLAHLRLDECRVPDDEVAGALPALLFARPLQTLSLLGAALSGEAWRLLAEGLRLDAAHPPERIYLANTEPPAIPLHVVEALAAALRKGRTTELHIDGAELCPAGTAALAAAIGQSKLRCLSIYALVVSSGPAPEETVGGSGVVKVSRCPTPPGRRAGEGPNQPRPPPTEEDSAATTIQKAERGRQARKQASTAAGKPVKGAAKPAAKPAPKKKPGLAPPEAADGIARAVMKCATLKQVCVADAPVSGSLVSQLRLTLEKRKGCMEPNVNKERVAFDIMLRQHRDRDSGLK